MVIKELGQSVALLGHNGAGKSTFIRFLLGFYHSPQAHPFLKNWQHIQPLDRHEIGYVPELPVIDPYLTGFEVINMMGVLKSVECSRQIAESLVQRVGLSLEALTSSVGMYSKGMKQRLMLAQAIMGKPKLLILDEPLSGLDPFGHQQVMTLLNELKSSCQVFISTHSLTDAFQLGEAVWLLKQGEFVYQGDCPKSQAALNHLYFSHPPDHWN